MARVYSEQLMLRLHRLDPERIGVQLAKKCVDYNLPSLYVASVLGVSRMSLHSWFNGKPLRDKNHQKVKKFMAILDEGKQAGVLPAQTLKAAKIYLDSVSDKITLNQ